MSAPNPSVRPKNHLKDSEGLQLASPYDSKISEALQPVFQEPKYSTDNNWHEAPQVVVEEEPKYLKEELGTISPVTPSTPAPAYRPYPINRGSEDGIPLTMVPTIDLEKNNKDTRRRKKRICGRSQPVFWLAVALALSIAITASIVGGVIPLQTRKDDQSP